MFLKTRFFEQKNDYEIVKSWWEARDIWKPIPKMMLPRGGIVVFDEDDFDKMICAGWLYLDNSSPVSMLEWIVTNPQNTNKQSYAGIKTLVGCADTMRKGMGYKIMMTTTDNDSLAKLLERCKFKVTDKNTTFLIKED